MCKIPPPTADVLPRWCQALLQQAALLAAAHERPGAPAYTRPVGAHLRHLIEHFEALLLPADAGGTRCVDYDARDRDAALEASPALAVQRITRLSARLQAPLDLQQPLALAGAAGLAGEARFDVATSLGRELAFVASHAVHHFALLAPHCRQHGLPVADDFGVAPGTVLHQRRLNPLLEFA